ncbi:GerMN domain-containing protein [Bariatricus sp. SGI.154]|uniref:GerMN domain-containing protein n=1 Tax=Bariatricus sp. SGI.154 TaxID=3420549 RepID=UPI003D0323CE
MNQKKKYYSIVCILLCLFLVGCTRGKEPGEGETFLCFVNAEGTALVKEAYEMKEKDTESQIGDMLKNMAKEPDSIDYKSVFSEKVQVQEWTLNEGILDLHFNSAYEDMRRSEEVLFRAAVVQTLAQISEVEYIDFFIGDQPLRDQEGNEIGYMKAEDFIQNTGSSLYSYQVGDLKLYFANEKGDKLVQENVSIRYNSNMSMEKLIVEQLIKGPTIEGNKPVIPPETKILGISVKDGVCYVNLDEGFLNNTYMIDPKITVYAIVNSIVDGGSYSQVQILVGGESNIQYMGSVDLNKPLSRDLDLVEENEK